MKRWSQIALVLLASTAITTPARAGTQEDLLKCIDLSDPVAAMKRTPTCVKTIVQAAIDGAGALGKLLKVGLADFVRFVKTSKDVLVCFAQGAGGAIPDLVRNPVRAVGNIVGPAMKLLGGVPLAAGKEIMRVARDVRRGLIPIGRNILRAANDLSLTKLLELPLQYFDLGWNVAKKHAPRAAAAGFAMVRRYANVWPYKCLLGAQGLVSRMNDVLIGLGDGLMSVVRVLYKEYVVKEIPKLLEKTLEQAIKLLFPNIEQTMSDAVVKRILELDQKLAAMRRGDDVDLSQSAVQSFFAAADELGKTLGGVVVAVIKKAVMLTVDYGLKGVKWALKKLSKWVLDAVSANLTEKIISEVVAWAVPTVIVVAGALLSSETGGWAGEVLEVSHVIVSTLTELLNLGVYALWDPVVFPVLIEKPLDEIWDFAVAKVATQTAEWTANILLKPVGDSVDVAITRIRDKIASLVPVPGAVEKLLRTAVAIWDKISPPQAAKLKAHVNNIKGLIQDLAQRKSKTCLKAIPKPPMPPSSPVSELTETVTNKLMDAILGGAQ